MRSINYPAALRGSAYLVATVGLLFIVLSRVHPIAIWIAGATLIRHAPAYAAEQWKTTIKQREVLHGYNDNSLRLYFAKVGMKLEYPKSVYADDSFSVRLADLTASDFVTKEFLLGSQQGTTISNPHWNADELHGLFEDARLGFVLSVTDAAVIPNGVVLLNNGTAEWVVRPNHAGAIKGLLEIHVRETTAERERRFYSHNEPKQDPEYLVFADDSSRISVDVADRLVTTEKLVGWIGTFFGAFLTLPGILAFLHARREKAERKKQDGEESRRIIIQP